MFNLFAGRSGMLNISGPVPQLSLTPLSRSPLALSVKEAPSLETNPPGVNWQEVGRLEGTVVVVES